MKTKILSILFLLFIISCKKIELKVKLEPEKPLQGQKVKLKLSQSFKGYIWWAEFSGGDPYKIIPHVEEVKGEKEIEIRPLDTNTSLVLFAFEESNGNLRVDSTYYIVYYTK